MYYYYTSTVWAVNSVFIAGIIATIAAIFFSIIIKGYLWRSRRRKLLDIKNNVYRTLLAGKEASARAAPQAIRAATPEQFIDVAFDGNRDAVFFNKSEKEYFKKCFVTPENIARLSTVAAGSWNKWRRIEAILCLGYTETGSAVDILARSLRSRDADIAHFTAVALGQIKTVPSARALLGLLKADPSDRYKISAILDGFPPETADEVINLTDDDNPAVRSMALTLLSLFSPARHIRRIEKFAEDSSPEVRAAACKCLGAIGGAAVKPSLTARLKDESWLVKMRAVQALEKALGDAAVPEVIGLVSDASWSVNGAVKDVMIAHVDAALPYIEKFLAGEDEIAKKYSVIALEASGRLLKILRDVSTGKDKADAMRILERIVKGKFHFSLEAALAALDPAVRAAAIAVLEKMDHNLAEHIDKKLRGLAGEESRI